MPKDGSALRRRTRAATVLAAAAALVGLLPTASQANVKRRRPGAVRSRPTGCAFWNPPCLLEFQGAEDSS